MNKIPQQIIGNVGECIYCGEKKGNLSDEHIIPFGLNGPFLLKNASCAACAKITSKFEMEVMRGALLKPRVGLDLPTRNKKKRINQLEFDVTINGQNETILLEPEENFSAMIFPEYLPPAHLSGKPIEKGITIYASQLVQVSGPPLKKLKEKYGFDTLSVTVTWGASAFPRLLAKIGYGFAVAKLGIENIDDIYILPYIITDKFDGISEWVGTASDRIMTENGFHTVILNITDTREIIARIKLFSVWKVPEYLVVVGKLNEKKFKQLTSQ